MTQRVMLRDVWRDRDPRSPNEVEVIGIGYAGDTPTHVRIRRPSRSVMVRLDRFVRRFDLVRRNPLPTEVLHESSTADGAR